MSFPINKEDILQASNGGLDIILELIPQANLNKHFQIRDNDKSFSASLWKASNGEYYVKDFGDYGGFFEKGKNAIRIYAHFHNIGYFDALKQLASKYGIIQEVALQNFEKRSFSEFEGELNDDGYEIVYEDEFTEADLDYLGPLVTDKVCEKLGFRKVREYSWIKYSENKDGSINTDKSLAKVFTKKSSILHPLFALIVPEKTVTHNRQGKPETFKIPGFIKILQPGDKDYRFRYFGKTDDNHIFGLDYIESFIKKNMNVEDHRDVKGDLKGQSKYKGDSERGGESSFNIDSKKVKRIFIASGDRDALNIASTGEFVVWFNSETKTKTPYMMSQLYKYADEVINIPDIDPTGIDAGKSLALEYLDVKTVWLPEQLYSKRGHYGKNIKDFTDFIKALHNPDDDDYTDLMIKVKRTYKLARPGKFWSFYQSVDNAGKPKGKPVYSIHHMNAFNFLRLNGFYRVKREYTKDEYYYVQQKNHIIREVSAQEIKYFFLKFLEEKQQEKGLSEFPDELMNMLITSEAISDKKLASLDEKKFDFKDYTFDSQFFFFDRFIWKISKDKIDVINKGYHRYVKEEDILNNIIDDAYEMELNTARLKVLEPFFKVGKDESGNWNLDILRNDCEFMNYLINASRVHWKKEIINLKPEQKEDYLREHNFRLDNAFDEKLNAGLSPDEIYEQQVHFINKCYALGYLLHNQKVSSKAWLVYAMDNEVVEDGTSHGRTGKSLFMDKAVRIFKKSKYIGARDPKVTDSEFKYHGVTKETKYILYDDADKRFPFQKLFTDITGELHVNPKSGAPYSIGFYDSAKIGISTNFAPFDLDPSSMDRLLFCSWSDYYHGDSALMTSKKPKDDFGHEFFKDWTDEQWALFINFCAQCVQLYLSSKEKIGAPFGNIRKRNILIELGVSFIDWADNFFNETNLNKEHFKKDLMDDLFKEKAALKGMSSTLFKKRMEQYCELKEYEFNPKSLINDHKNIRIIRDSKEVFYVRVRPADPIDGLGGTEIIPEDSEPLF